MEELYAFYHFCRMLFGFGLLYLLKPRSWRETTKRFQRTMEQIRES